MKVRAFLKHAASAALVAWLAAAGSAAHADDYPQRSVKLIIPFPPGGTLDVIGRSLAQRLSEQTGQTFIVDNRPGGNGTIGANAVMNSRADGYTLLFNASTFLSAPMTMKSVVYDTQKDFAPIALVAKAPLSVAINKDLPVSDINSLLDYAKTHAGQTTFAVGSIGSAGHLSTELLRRAGGLEYLIVPYRGTAPVFQDLLGGRVDGFIDPILGSLSYHQSGLLKVIAVTSKERSPILPDVPTVGESIDGYEFYSWYGLWAPADTPAEVLNTLNREVNVALQGPMKAQLEQQGLMLAGGSIEAFKQFQNEEADRFQTIITEGNIRVE